MLNFRKLRQDFASGIVKDGKDLYEKQKVISARILHLDSKIVRISGRIQGPYDNCYESTIEIDRAECEAIDSDCDCSYSYDCQHLAALIFYLEERLDEIMVNYSRENNLEELADHHALDVHEKEELIHRFKAAESKESQRQEELLQKQLLHEYALASEVLSSSPFFRVQEVREVDKAEVAIVFQFPATFEGKQSVELMMALRLPARSKPLQVPNVRKLFESMRCGEPLYMGGRRYHFTLESFSPFQAELMTLLLHHAKFYEDPPTDKGFRIAQIDVETLATLLARAYREVVEGCAARGIIFQEDELRDLPGIFDASLEHPLRCCPQPALLKFVLEYLKPPLSKAIFKPTLLVDQRQVSLEDVKMLPCTAPGMLYRNVYHRFASHITRQHLNHLKPLADLIIPEPLLGSLMENAIPQLARFALVDQGESMKAITTLPHVEAIRATCDLVYLEGELEATFWIHYGPHRVPVAPSQLTFEAATSFVTPAGIVARNLVEERKLTEELFQDFTFNIDEGMFITKSEKKIVEFMTDTIPRHQHRVTFHCPQNLLDQFVYDRTEYVVRLSHTERVDTYTMHLEVTGPLKGVKMDMLWDSLASRRAYLEMDYSRSRGKRGEGGKAKILVLDLSKIGPVVQLFDELGIEVLDNHTVDRPLWSLANIDASQFQHLPVQFSMTERLSQIRLQMTGAQPLETDPIPDQIQAELRPYQKEGVHWLERLRAMYLSGILADDMGLGKTLQAIVAIVQYRATRHKPTLIVCPTSLLYNWKEECAKFAPHLKVLVIDGVPAVRKKLVEQVSSYDVVITSYTLLQKDADHYTSTMFGYCILDEAQHIKNRGTRNAKSVKRVAAEHRLILSGTPIENSLDEMWSLFDFLMPGFLGTFDRFVEKYLRVPGPEQSKNLEYLRKKVAPFILRRMKGDVLSDLPPMTEIVHYCPLSELQQQLYQSYAESARNELVKLVEREGFDRVQIHVLATLTRLKQICCHPAIFAKEKAEPGDSVKYDFLLELIQNLIEGKHKTVIFSQYTRMLQIMRADFEQMGIRFCYLDGSSKNRLETVKQFNEDESIPVFLVSLKAGGTGLNLVGADTVILFDMWWNPAIEEQAAARVHRRGQKKKVFLYKLYARNTIEEKIAEMQSKKKGLVKKVVSCDDEVITKLTWEDVLKILTP